MNSVEMKSLPLELTPEQIADLEKLAGIAFTPDKIATYFGIDHDVFLKEFNDPTSKIRHHFDKGHLQAMADVNKGTLKRARDGNLTSIAQLSKEWWLQKLEASKQRRVYTDEKENYEQLQAYIQTGQIGDIPPEQLEYFEQLDYIRCLFGKYESKGYILNAVRLKWPNLSKFQSNKLYNESLNFFYLDNDVKVEAWQNIYADYLDNLAKICYDMNDFETSRRCTMDAAKLRGVGSEKKDHLPPEFYDRRPVFYTIKPEDVGMARENRHKIKQYIDSLPIMEKEKNRAKRDALVEDIEFDLMPDENAQG
jgi:hypothetical protein